MMSILTYRTGYLTSQTDHNYIHSHRYSFFPRTAKVLNTLSLDICYSPDLGSFRAGLLKTLLNSIKHLSFITHHLRLISMHQSLFIFINHQTQHTILPSKKTIFKKKKKKKKKKTKKKKKKKNITFKIQNFTLLIK